ncbi:porin [Thiohalocapsa marina]|uniref:Porin n=2 Tax=Thiohalocapsa marina TaxID=424902 RepID=A0A5M8FDP2_9GAMM|nr:porin [Thiohalocapsa marina]
MRQTVAATLLTPALLAPTAVHAASDAEIAELRAMLANMQAQYETRIGELEQRLAVAEQKAARAERVAGQAAGAGPSARSSTTARSAAAPVSRSMTAAVVHSSDTGTAAQTGGGVFGAMGAGNAFNPQISAILDGNYYHDDLDGAGSALVSEAFQASSGQAHDHADADGDAHDHGHAHGTADNGFNFREAELSFSATVDPYFDAALYLAIDGDGNVELEEGYFQTRALPHGLRVKGGKFLSDFGYANRQHPHEWDFVDQNLPYLNLLGVHGLQDTGLQLTWLPELPVYTLFGVEALQGDQEVFGATLSETEQSALNLDSTEDGPRLMTAFVKVAPEIGEHHALRLGASYAYNRQQQLVLEHVHAHDDGDDAHDEVPALEDEIHSTGLEGDAILWGLDLVYKYDGAGAHGKGDFKLQTEYLRSSKDLRIRASAHPEQIGGSRRFVTDGLYAQALYGFAPRWTAGLRYDVLGLTNEVRGGSGDDFGSSERWTADVTWSLSEFSKLRAQYAHNDILVAENERERFDAFYLQFLMSLGSHGAHAF